MERKAPRTAESVGRASQPLVGAMTTPSRRPPRMGPRLDGSSPHPLVPYTGLDQGRLPVVPSLVT